MGDNIKTNLKETGWGVDWIYLAQDRNTWRAVVEHNNELRVPQNVGNFLTSRGSVGVSKDSAACSQLFTCRTVCTPVCCVYLQLLRMDCAVQEVAGLLRHQDHPVSHTEPDETMRRH